MPLKVLILDEHAPEYFTHLTRKFPGVGFHAARGPEEAKGFVADAEIIIALAHKLPHELIKAARSLKWVQALSTGTDALIGALPSHILLTSTRGVHGPQMSELAFLHMLALNRNFVRMRQSQTEGKWDRHAQPLLEGKTIVIVGLGILAEHLAARCKLFGMEVIGVSAGRKHAPNFDEVYPRAVLRELAARADFLMLLVPYSKDTHHLVNAEILSAMKPSAFVINLARGGVLDEAALIAHLKANKIAGAGLDVFSQQPLPPESPLWHLSNVIITPNVGGHSDKFVEQTLAVVAPNLQAYLDGRTKDLINIVAH
jgi:phosphoglycerate dehydrogenase-like enzyme